MFRTVTTVCEGVCAVSDEIEALLGRIGHSKGGRQKSYYRQVMEIAYKNGLRSKSKSAFIGRRIGRGGVIGALAVGVRYAAASAAQ